MAPSSSATKPQSRLRDKKRTLYRETIVDAAERVFGEEGFDATKVQRIAAEAGVSLTTLYSVFESKWEIYRAVNEARLNELMDLIQGILKQENSALDTIVAGARTMLDFFMDRPAFARMQLKEVTAWGRTELLRSPEQVQALSTGLELFRDFFRRAIDEGDLVADDPELMSRTTIASQQVRLAIWMERGMTEPPEAVADAAIRHTLRSYCRPERLAAALRNAGIEGRT